ncbi:MAG: hypothetical protein QOJ11_4193 [Frankiales bacterium]|jgi:hypothetical protein|nr:hypothetical protein [Frankiales bacterium]
MERSNRRLFRRAAALGILVASLVAPTVAQAAVSPPSVTLEGTYTLVHVDGTAGHPSADGYHQELRAGGRAYDVKLGSGVAFRSGDSVRLTGRLQGATISVQHSSITAFAPDVPAIGGTTRVLVILAEWNAPDSTTQASAANVFAADSTWFNQTSYGHLSLSTTVTDWVHVSAPPAGLCSDSNVSDQLTNRALTASGYTAADFDRVVVYFPASTDSGCRNVAGFAEAPGNRVWLNGTMDTRSTIHEQGHNYGLYHAHSAACTTPGAATAAVAPDATADNCTYADYGDPFDAMGASGLVAEYSAGQKDDLGWLDAGRKATLTTGSTLGLVPYEQQSTAVHAAVFAASTTRSYWFENRAATGPDSALPPGATAGVLVHLVDSTVDAKSGEASYWASAQSYLLDQSPGDHWLGTSVLPYGQSWTSPEGVTFSIGSPSGGEVPVSAGVGTSSPASWPTGAPAAGARQPALLTARFATGQSTLRVTQGAAALISGTALQADGSAVGGSTVQVQATPHGRAVWRTVGSLTVPASGLLSGVFRPVGTSDYRLLLQASGDEGGAVSNVLTVVVRPSVIAAVTKPIVEHGRTVGLNVSIPGHAGQVVTVQRWVHNAWKPCATARLGVNGKRSVVVRLLAKGHYVYRFVKAADAFHLGAVSKPLPVRAV